MTVKSRWAYLYGAVASRGQTVDCLLSVRRDTAAPDGPISGSPSPNHIGQVLLHELGGIAVTDNLGSHRGAGVRAAIEAAGTSLLYPHSPDFNSAGREFAKLKARLRKADERTLDDPGRSIGRITGTFASTASPPATTQNDTKTI